MQILANLDKDNRHAGILADWSVFCLGNLGVADNLVKDIAANRRLFCLSASLERFIYVLRQIISSLFAHLRYFFGNFPYFDRTQSKTP